MNCATGEFWHTFPDFNIPGRGPALSLTRTFSSGRASVDGPFGFGWADNYNESIAIDGSSGEVTVVQDNGSTVTFVPDGSGGYIAPPRVLSALVANGDGTFTFTPRLTRISEIFSSTGELLSKTDLNGNSTTLNYTAGQLTSVTESSGRKLTVTHSGNRIATVSDPLGRTTTYSYDSNGNLAQSKDALGRAWSFTYNGSHQLLSLTDPRGGTTTNVYDSSGRVTSQTDPAGLTTTWSYTGDAVSPAGGTTLMADEHGNVTQYDYANLELLTLTKAVGTPLAATARYTYDPATLGVTTVTDPNGHVTSNAYDGDGNLISTTDALGKTTTYDYDSLDNIVSTTAPLGETTAYSYDAAGNRLSMTDPLGNETVYTYDDANHPGDMTSTADPDGRVRNFTYDGNGNLASITFNPRNGVTDTTTLAYDADSERVCEVSANSNAAGVTCSTPGRLRVAGTTTRVYDAGGQLLTLTDPNGHTTTSSYDADGNRTSTTDAKGNVTNTAFDADNRVIAIITGANGPSPSTQSTAYDLRPGVGGCASPPSGATYCRIRTDGNGNATVDYVDALDDVIQEVAPLGNRVTHTYDGLGNELTRTDSLGRVTSFTYDTDNRRTSTTYSDGTTPNVTLTYDDDGRRISLTDGTGTTSYGYDADGRTTSVTNGANATLGYAYDAVGDATTLTYPNAQTVTRSFDGARRLVSVTDFASKTTRFGYDHDGNVVSVTYPNGDSASSTFDAVDQMSATKLAPTTSPSSPLAATAYARDPAGLVTQESDSGALIGDTSFAYDAKTQLIGANSDTYGYDLAGNPTGVAGIGQTFNAASELVQSTTGTSSTTYAYDALGERTSATRATGTTSYGYDQAGRLISVAGSTATAGPTVTRISPTFGPPSGGTVVSIRGSGFAGATAVRFGSVDAVSFRVKSAKLITATAPPGTGTVDLTVTTPSGTSTTSPVDEFTYTAGPTIRRISPKLGPASGGTLVHVRGTGFTDVRGVRFGNKARHFIVKSPTELLVQSPAGKGTVDITVKTKLGTSPTSPRDEFTFVAGPHVSRVVPRSGPESGGTLIRVHGFNFTGTRAVFFGSTKQSHFIVRSDSLILVQSPPSTGTVDIIVKAPHSQSDPVPSDQFTYIATTSTSARQSVGPSLSTSSSTYAYDGDGLRQAKTVGGAIVEFTWDSTGDVPLLVGEGSEYYVYGPGDAPIEKITESATLFLHQDQLTSTRLVTSSSGSVVGTTTYAAYGSTAARSGTASTALGFAGQYTDAETGLIYLRARYYDSSTAQFLTRDPITATTAAPYTYVDNNPLNGIDPSGFCNEATVRCVIGILTGTEELPTGFAEWETARSTGFVYYVDTHNGNRAVLSTGGCSVPVVGDHPAAFHIPCQTHDLGYDLMRCFNSSGQKGDIRKAVDNNFFNDLKGVVAGSPWYARPGGAILARSYYEAVSVNSRLQGYGVP